MGEEDQRTVREGLNEENLAIFDVLVKRKAEDLDTRTRNRVKDVARELLDKVKAELAKLDHWKDKRQTQAQVQQLIYDYLYSDETGLPVDAYTDDEVQELAEVVYLHVYEKYETAANNVYAGSEGEGVPA